MKSVNVATLKNHIREYLGAVEAGEELVVTSHSHPVARVVPYRTAAGLDVQKPRRSLSGIKKLRGVRPLKPVDPAKILQEDCRRR